MLNKTGITRIHEAEQIKFQTVSVIQCVLKTLTLIEPSSDSTYASEYNSVATYQKLRITI